MPTLPIPDSAFSYIETDVAEVVGDPEGHGLDIEDYKALATIMLYTDMEKQTVRVPTAAGDRKVLADAFIDLANVVDDNIESGRSDNRRLDAAARRAFQTLSDKMRRG